MTWFDYFLIATAAVGLLIWLIELISWRPSRDEKLRQVLGSTRRGTKTVDVSAMLKEPVLVENAKFVFALASIIWFFRNFQSALDFGLILVLSTLISGLIVVLDKWYLRARRERHFQADFEQQQSDKAEIILRHLNREPGIVEFSRSVFPVILAILILRSFIMEPFQIPSGSMKPTLEVGDFILVNKYAYGVRLPITHQRILKIGEPKRGDVFVFRYPGDPSLDYIKRVIGLPGDRILYRDKRLYIQPACDAADPCPKPQLVDEVLKSRGGYKRRGTYPVDIYTEDLGGVKHEVLHNPRYRIEQGFRQSCMSGYNEWVVPQGHYFAMGDNRENSEDSRFWCFVPEQNLVGKAVAIWMHFNSKDRKWFNFSRIGGIE